MPQNSPPTKIEVDGSFGEGWLSRWGDCCEEGEGEGCPFEDDLGMEVCKDEFFFEGVVVDEAL